MSKSIFSIVIDVVAIGLMFIPGIGTALGIGMKIAGLGITVAQAVGAGLMIASSVLLGPAKPKPLSASAATQRLYATLVTTAPRKWCFGGPTAMATDMRYQTFTGSNQEYYHSVICVASHKVQSIDEIWFDNEKAAVGTTVQGRYSGYLTVVAIITEGTSANGVGIDSTWTSSCTLTGCAYIVLKYKMTGNSDNAQSPFQGGITNRITIRGKGAFVYDPRLDTTVTGGSGTQRANDQTTWTWDANGSRNPALQLLWFLLGWKINGKLALGMGLPPARIDLPSFIAAANVCDEVVTLNGGGTEPRYRCDGVLAEDEDRQAVIESLCSQMNATLRDNGGKLALTCLHNDLSAPVASFTEADILQGGKWAQTLPLSRSFNIVRGRRIDPSDTALYQPVDFPEVSLTSPDGIDRIDTVDYPFVQSNGQAQRLAKQRLQRNQYQGRYSFVGGERWWQVNVGDVIQISHQAYGWSNKLFRVVEQAINPGTVDQPGGDVKITLLEENAAIYAWANNEAAPVTPGTPTIYNPLNSPLLLAINQQGGAVADANRVRLSRCERGTQGYQFTNPNTLAGLTWQGNSFAGKNYVRLNGSWTAASQSVSIYTDNTASYRVTVAPNERIYASAAMQIVTLPASSTWILYVAYLDSSGAFISQTQLATGSATNAFGTRAGNFDTAPGTAAFAYLTLGLFSNAGTTGAWDFLLLEPMICGAGAFQTVQPIFTPGPSNEIAAETTKLIPAPTQSLQFSYNGNTGAAIDLAGGATRDILFKLTDSIGGTFSSGVTWSYTVLNGTINGFNSASGAQTMSVSSGVGTITVSSLGSDTVKVQVTATYGAASYTYVATFAKTYTAPSTGGAGGSTTDFNQTTFTTPITLTTTFQDVTGWSPSVSSTTVNAVMDFTPNGTAAYSGTVEMKLQKNVGGTPTDIGVTQSAPSTNAGGGSPPEAASFSYSLGSLTGTFQYRVMARVTVGSKAHSVSGSFNGTH